MRVRLLLRALAIAIAVMAAVDPVITSERRVRPEISLIAGSRLPDPALAGRVASTLSSRFTVTRGPSIGAVATVVVGDELPPAATSITAPGFALRPEPRAPFVQVTAVQSPLRAHVHSRVPVTVQVRTVAAQGRKLTVSLHSRDLLLDRVTRDVVSNDDSGQARLTFVPSAPGTHPFVVTAEIDGAPDTRARADAGIEIRDRRWAVLVFDPRPSWMSTFVRRALESDPRFVVTSRVATTRGGGVAAGQPPASLSQVPSLALFDVVVAGAPEDLTDADVSGLEQYLRHRAGAVILLPDQLSEQRPYLRLAGIDSWRLIERLKPEGDPPASAFLAPAARGDTEKLAPAPVLRSAVGSGRLIVSTAIDAWHYRDAADGAFRRFWTTAIAEAADATPHAIDLLPDRWVLPPGTSTQARVTRGPADPIETMTLRPETKDGPALFEVVRDGSRAAVTLLVVPGATAPASDDRRLIDAWTAATGGAVILESRLADLATALEQRINRGAEHVRWFPMRSIWWLVPFAGALGAEWWLRRRAGLR